jgi:hypothetical protein
VCQRNGKEEEQDHQCYQASSTAAPHDENGGKFSQNFGEYDDVIRSRDCFLEIDSVYEAVAGIQPVLGWIRSVLVQLWIWFRMNETGDLSFLSKKHNFDK